MCSSVGVVGLLQVTFPHFAARSRRMTDLQWNSGSPRARQWHQARSGPRCPRGRGSFSNKPQEKPGSHFSSLVVVTDLSSLYSSHSVAAFIRVAIQNCKEYVNAFIALKHGWTCYQLCPQFTGVYVQRALATGQGWNRQGRSFEGLTVLSEAPEESGEILFFYHRVRMSSGD